MVDVNSYQHGVLNLSSINKPGGVQRRVNEEDQLNIRNYFREGDIISAEVQQVNSTDGKISLHTRNSKYGKLQNGFLVKADSNYVRRMKNHMIEIAVGDSKPVGCILGANGYVWIHGGVSAAGTGGQMSVSATARESMAIVRNAIVCLEGEQLPIFKETVEQVVERFHKIQGEEKDIKWTSKSMLDGEEARVRVCETAKELIQKEIQA